MSGGSYDYAYGRVAEMADRLEGNSPDSPERMAFVAHLRKVAKAMRDIEWVDSSDKSPGDEMAAIMECVTEAEVLDAATARAESALATLTSALEAVRGVPDA
jgi:hypothetical protein